MPLPEGVDWVRIADNLWRIWNFPNCVAAIDGKHVQIEAPANSDSQYFNYKSIFSIALMALVDAEYTFNAFDIGTYDFGQRFENNNINIPQGRTLPNTDKLMPYVMVRDETFPLKLLSHKVVLLAGC